jgi:hypothetical protein
MRAPSPETPDERLLRFLERRRAGGGEASHRRNRVLIAVLSVACVALAITNVALVMRTPEHAPATMPPAVASPARPTPHARSDGSVGPGAGATEGAPAARPAPVEPPAAPFGSSPGNGQRIEPGGGRSSWASDGEAAEHVAAWMVRHYGPTVAEAQARSAASFYSPADPMRAYWAGVLARIRQSSQAGAPARP